MKTNKTIQKTIAAMTGLAALASPAANATVSVQMFSPSSGNKYTYTENAQADLPDGEVALKYRRYLVGMTYNFINDPLVTLNSERTERVKTDIEGIQTMNLLAGFDYNGRFAVNVDVPLNIVHMPGVAAQFGLGDIRLMTKGYLLSNKSSRFGLALMPEIRLPSGNRDLFLSDGAVSAGLAIGAEYNFGVLSMAVNAGYRRIFGGGQYDIINFQNQVPLKLGVSIPIGPRWAINAEGTGTIMVPYDRFQMPSEFYAGARYRPTNDMSISLGAAVGSVNRISSADWRILAGVKFAPASKTLAQKVITQAPKKAEPARVEFTAKEVIIREEVRFEHNSDVLTPSGKSLLDEVAKVLKENRGNFAKIDIEGHTNEIGSQPYNLVLSTKRANSVRQYLISRGIESEVLAATGFGKLKPKSDGLLLSRQARLEIDRRVEFKVVAPEKSVKKEAAPKQAPSQAKAHSSAKRG